MSKLAFNANMSHIAKWSNIVYFTQNISAPETENETKKMKNSVNKWRVTIEGREA